MQFLLVSTSKQIVLPPPPPPLPFLLLGGGGRGGPPPPPPARRRGDPKGPPFPPKSHTVNIVTLAENQIFSTKRKTGPSIRRVSPIFGFINFLVGGFTFFCAGVYYRPASLKGMTVLYGDSDTRKVYKNFKLDNLNTNQQDMTHHLYQKYLEQNFFTPLFSSPFFAHCRTNILPERPTSSDQGHFNIFPLSLMSDDLKDATTLGVVTTSPLKLELEFSPVLTTTWYLSLTFLYTNRVSFSGSKNKQEVTYEYI